MRQDAVPPAQDGHGLALVAADQQGVHVVVKDGQRHLQTDEVEGQGFI